MDVAIMLALQSVRVDGLTQLMALLSALGNAGFCWFVIAALMLFFPRSRSAGLVTALAVACCDVLIACFLAGFVGRVGPFDAGIGVTAVAGVSRALCTFPSLHAATGAAAVAATGMLRGKVGAIPCGILALAIAFARVFCGVSYPSDVLGGAVLGIVVGLVLSFAANQLLFAAVGGKAIAGGARRRESVGGGKHSRY